MRRVITGLVLAAALFASAALPLATADDHCVKERGTWTCTSFEGPGNNQAGVGTTTTKQTKGNLENTSPEPQNLADETSCNPPKSQGKPCSP